MGIVLGLNLGHDRSACLMKDGKIAIAIEEERLDRIKHSIGYTFSGYFDKKVKELPMRSIQYCLDYMEISLDDIDLVVGNMACEDSSEKIIKSSLPIKDKNKIVTIPSPSHHYTHALCSYFSSGFNDAAILVADAMGSFIEDNNSMEAESMFVAKGNSIDLIRNRKVDIENNLTAGLYYDYVTSKLDFVTKYGNSEFGAFKCGGITECGKTMGLSAYGKYRSDWQKIITKEREEYIINPQKLNGVFEITKFLERENLKASKKHTVQFYRDWSYKVQKELEDYVMELVDDLYKNSESENLCLSGGVFLNSVLNYRISKESKFKNVYVFPATNDAGISVGCAYYGSLILGDCISSQRVSRVGFGKKYDETEIRATIENFGLSYRKTSPKEIAELVCEDNIIGFFYGESEFGPRALGHRSIIASAKNKNMKDILNERVKFREGFRPFAPIVPHYDRDKYFDIHHDSNHMLYVAPVKDEWVDELPSITHIDKTARLQTVTKDVGPIFDVLEELKKIMGISVMINTSFNVAGQPIVESPEDALQTFVSTNIDKLVLYPFLVFKED